VPRLDAADLLDAGELSLVFGLSDNPRSTVCRWRHDELSFTDDDDKL